MTSASAEHPDELDVPQDIAKALVLRSDDVTSKGGDVSANGVLAHEILEETFTARTEGAAVVVLRETFW